MLAVAICAAGCAPGMDAESARATKAIDDKFLPYNEIAGAAVAQNTGGVFNSGRVGMQLLARRDRKTGALTTHARVMIHYQKRQRYRFEQARAPTTELLPMRELWRSDAAFCKEDQGCPHTEDILIDIPEPQLRAAQQTGYAFRIYSRDGDHYQFNVPTPLIQALFKAADATAPGTTASTVAANAKR